jgi:hypothetical protein
MEKQPTRRTRYDSDSDEEKKKPIQRKYGLIASVEYI